MIKLSQITPLMWVCLGIAAFVLFILTLWIFRWWMQGTQFKKKHLRVAGKVVIITGCNSGVGKETALDLARRGAKIYLACRDEGRGLTARLQIIRTTSNNNIFYIQCDLASMASIRNFVKEFLRVEHRLDILINNAGVAFCSRQETKDGYELQFGVNHLGHFLLTNLLMDTLKASTPSRIINVSAMMHYWGRINRTDINHTKSYDRFRVHFQSKLANVLFTRSLSKRLMGSGVTANSLNPGLSVTNLYNNMHPMVAILLLPLSILLKTEKNAAQTSICLAVDPELEQVSGKYFSECKIKTESDRARDDELAEWLWDTSETMTGLKEQTAVLEPIVQDV